MLINSFTYYLSLGLFCEKTNILFDFLRAMFFSLNIDCLTINIFKQKMDKKKKLP